MAGRGEGSPHVPAGVPEHFMGPVLRCGATTGKCCPALLRVGCCLNHVGSQPFLGRLGRGISAGGSWGLIQESVAVALLKDNQT